MKEFRWSSVKDAEILRTRGVSFEQLLRSRFIGLEKNPRKSHQRLMLFEYKRYVWVVPYVKGEGCFFLKTAFPSRKHTRKYLEGKND